MNVSNSLVAFSSICIGVSFSYINGVGYVDIGENYQLFLRDVPVEGIMGVHNWGGNGETFLK